MEIAVDTNDLPLSLSLSLSVSICLYTLHTSPWALAKSDENAVPLFVFLCVKTESKTTQKKTHTFKWIFKMPMKTHPNLMFGHRDRIRSTGCGSVLACVCASEDKKVNWLDFICINRSAYLQHNLHSLHCFFSLDSLLSHRILDCLAYTPFQWSVVCVRIRNRAIDRVTFHMHRTPCLVLNNIFITVNRRAAHTFLMGHRMKCESGRNSTATQIIFSFAFYVPNFQSRKINSKLNVHI